MNSNIPSYTFVDSDKTKEMLQLWKAEKHGWVQVGDKKWLYPSIYTKEGPGYYNFEVRSSDIWVLSFPRSGTHWTIEMVWLLSNNLDFETAGNNLLFNRFHFFGANIFLTPEVRKTIDEGNKMNVKQEEYFKNYASNKFLDALESPRFIYSHFPPSLLPNVIDSGCKIVYVARNPKDVAVSYYFFNKAFGPLEYIGDFPTFWNYFKNNLMIYGPYWEHLKEAWAQKDNPNFLFIFYEEMKADLLSTAKKVSTFLGKAYSDEDLLKLVENLDFKNFKNNPMRDAKAIEEGGLFLTTGVFIREGKSGNWKSTFTEELEKEADEWITENLKDTDLIFPMEKLIS